LCCGDRRETIGREVRRMKVRPGAVVRGTGVALACLAGDASKRSPILLTGFAIGWFLDRPGLQVFTVIPDTEEPWKRTTVPVATSVGSWSAVMLAAMTGLRRTRLPVPVAAVLLGGGLVVVDSLLADLGEAREAAEVEKAHPETGTPAT
jgi:hypothetical protein